MDYRYHPPPKKWKELVESINQFQASYNIGLIKNNYDKVRVLHVTWDRDTLPDFIQSQMEQSQQLEKTFMELYKYDTKRVVLPHYSEATAYQMLAAAIREDTEQLTKQDLLILHYQGHGEYTIQTKYNSTTQENETYFSKRLVARSWKVPEDASNQTIELTKLDFTKLRKDYIDNTAPYVLMLMDCCHAAAAPCGPLPGKELLAASAMEFTGEASWRECSFTNNVNNILKHAYDTRSILPTFELYTRLYANRWTLKDAEGDVRKLETEPVHMLLHKGSKAPIILAPLQGVVSKYNHVVEVPYDPTITFVRIDCFVTDDELLDEQNGLHIRTGCYGMIQALGGFITRHGVHRAGSYVVELEMPVSTWYCVGHLPDLHFRYVKGPRKLNPPNFLLPVAEYIDLLTIRPRGIPGQSDESSKTSRRNGSETQEDIP
ncbi:hypothetical protein DHEL01_v205999 [Diaporthe helianthi]|uniref:Caspase domain-containing protein n=1 Tax=Diaporthe helianthi TaxID=158607 RepID=A0A2P5HZD2_DIAHE|nr:hypothetical protein DHEL01_v205999 [Diaporthe helianthi]